MAEVPIKISADVANEAEANAVARELADALRSQVPPVTFETAPSLAGSMILGEVLTIGLTHIVVMGVIDGIRLVWEMSRQPLLIKAPDGSEYIFRGNVEQADAFLNKLLSGTKADGERPDAKPS